MPNISYFKNDTQMPKKSTSEQICHDIMTAIVTNVSTIIDLKQTSHFYLNQKMKKICSTDCGMSSAAKILPLLLNDSYIYELVEKRITFSRLLNFIDPDDAAELEIDINSFVSLPSYPVAIAPQLEIHENESILQLKHLLQFKSCIKKRLFEIRENGRILESIVNRSHDINSRIRKYHSILHPLTTIPFQVQICGYNQLISSPEAFTPPLISDANYFSCHDLCLIPRKCIRHDRWETSKLLQVETEYSIASRQLVKCKNDIASCVKSINDRRLEIEKCRIGPSEEGKIPTSFLEFYDVSV